MLFFVSLFAVLRKVRLFLSLVLRLQRSRVMYAAQILQMMPELVPQNAAQQSFRLLRFRVRIDTVKGAFMENDLPNAGIDLVLSHDIEIVSPCVIRDDIGFGHDDTAGKVLEKLRRKLVQKLRYDLLVFCKGEHGISFPHDFLL